MLLFISPANGAVHRGASTPQQPWRYSPHCHVYPRPFVYRHPAPPTQTIFGHCIRNFVQIYTCFQRILKAVSQG